MSETVTEPTTEPTQPTEPAQQPTQPTEAPKPAEWDGKIESLPADAQKIIRDLRAENGERRTKLTAAEQQQQDILKAFAKAAGIQLPDDSDQQPDPAELTQKLTAAQERTRDAQAELIVWRNAKDLGVDPSAVTDSRAFERAIKDLDPTDAEAFAEAVKTAAKTAAENNPKLKAAQAATASGSDFTGGSGESAMNQEKFDSLTPSEKNAYFKTNPTEYRRFAGR